MIFKSLTLMLMVIIFLGCEEKEEAIPTYLEYADMNLSKVKTLPNRNYVIKKIANSYVLDPYIDANITEEKLTNCLGQYVFEKEASFKVRKILKWCVESNNTATYYNTSKLMNFINGWEKEYKSVVNIIKNNMHDPSSYDEISRDYAFTYYGTKRPHMSILIWFRGKNAYGALVRSKASLKIDAFSEEVYEININ